MKTAEFRIPGLLDAPERYLFWTMTEAMILIAPLVVGLMAGQFLLGLIMGPVLLMGFKKLTGTQGEKALLQVIYWFFLPPWGDGLDETPPAWIREYIG